MDQIAGFTNVGLSLSQPETTERLQAIRVSSNFFQLLGVDAFQGRTLLPEDDEPGKQQVVVLTHDCWRKRFSGNQQIVGTNIILDTKSYQVVGILPPRFELPIREAELAILWRLMPILCEPCGVLSISCAPLLALNPVSRHNKQKQI